MIARGAARLPRARRRAAARHGLHRPLPDRVASEHAGHPGLPARARGHAVAEIIRFAEQRTGLAGDADPDAVLAAIVELLDGARSAVTGTSRPA